MTIKNKHPRVGVAIVTYNGADWILRCLASLRDSTEPNIVVVVDNCSTDNTCDLVREHHSDVVLIDSKRNTGFGVGNNFAIAHLLRCRCEMVFLLNQDAYVLPGTLAALRILLDGHPEIGVVSPLHCSPNEDHVDFKTFCNYLGAKTQAFCDDALMGRQLENYQIPGINAAAWLVRSAVFNQIGGFDPLFFMYGEDDDLLERMKEHEIIFSLLPSARVVHLRQSPGSPAPRSWIENVRRHARRQRSVLLLLIKRPGYSQSFRLRLLLSHGLIHPLAAWLVRPDGIQLAASIVAACQLLVQISQVRKHANRLANRGPHFLIDEA